MLFVLLSFEMRRFLILAGENISVVYFSFPETAPCCRILVKWLSAQEEIVIFVFVWFVCFVLLMIFEPGHHERA